MARAEVSRRAPWRMAWLAALAGGAPACSALLGIDDVVYGSPDADASVADGSVETSASDGALDGTDDVLGHADAGPEATVPGDASGCANYDAFFCADFDEDAQIGLKNGVEVPLIPAGDTSLLTRGAPAYSAPNAVHLRVPAQTAFFNGSTLHVQFSEERASYHLDLGIQYAQYDTTISKPGDGYTLLDVTLVPGADAGTDLPCVLAFLINAAQNGTLTGTLLTRCPDLGVDAGVPYSVNLPAPGPGWRALALDVAMVGAGGVQVSLSTGVDTVKRTIPWPATSAALQISFGDVSIGKVGPLDIGFDDLVVYAK